MSNKIYRLVRDTYFVDFDEHHNREMEYYSNFKSAIENFRCVYSDLHSEWCTLYEVDYPNNIEDLVKLLNDEHSEGWVEVQSIMNATAKEDEEDEEDEKKVSNRW